MLNVGNQKKGQIMAWICRACSSIYMDSYYDELDRCPLSRCNGGSDGEDNLIYVDDVFAPIVAEFNKKGFEVESAVFGNPINVIDRPSEITFDYVLTDCFTEDKLNDIFSGLPDNWKFMIRDGKPVIECIYFADTDIERVELFMKAHLDLANFVDNVDELHY